ncbi:ribonuclease III [Candidatus Azambacteria bacterium]|nr:ribonuclease III [Candidatus Azambacteria bacterium]
MNLEKLENTIGVNFKNKDLLLQALTHRSYLNENPKFHLDHNERLEFLGDAVLELAVTEYLYRNYPNPEGELTSWRASLVNSKMLASIGAKLEINDMLLLSKGEAKDSGRARQYIITNAVEAIIGAAYLDQGYEVAADLIKRFILPELNDIIEKKLHKDAKSLLQELAQEKVNITPAYKVLKEWGPDHDRNFSVGVFLNEEIAGEGEGRSKQEAQQSAAEKALKNKGWN